MFFISFNCFATAQVPDYIIWEEDTLPMLTNPLESYFEAHNIKFSDLSSVRNSSTACCRGYEAIFEIKEGNLYVVNVFGKKYYKDKNGNSQFKPINVMDSIFPNQKEYLLKEYTGFLRIPVGERTSFVQMGYAYDYEGYAFIEIEKGKVIQSQMLTIEEYNLLKEAQYKEYIKTEEFQKHLNKLLENSKEEKHNADFYVQFLYKFFEPNINHQNGKLDFIGVKESLNSHNCYR